jgi:prepilin-type processing-associated H-X9-DG protein
LATIQKNFGTFTSNAWSHPTATGVRIPIYICPSDNPSGTAQLGKGAGVKFSRSNFVFCFGSDTMQPSAANQAKLGVFRFNSTSSFAVMSIDGASNTVMVSETVASREPTTGNPADMPGAWGYGGPGSSGYTHKNLPTSGAPGAVVNPASDTDFALAEATASSMHPGVVNVMFADNHGTQIATATDLTTWQSMATSNGQEAYAAGQ